MKAILLVATLVSPWVTITNDRATIAASAGEHFAVAVICHHPTHRLEVRVHLPHIPRNSAGRIVYTFGTAIDGKGNEERALAWDWGAYGPYGAHTLLGHHAEEFAYDLGRGRELTLAVEMSSRSQIREDIPLDGAAEAINQGPIAACIVAPRILG